MWHCSILTVSPRPRSADSLWRPSTRSKGPLIQATSASHIDRPFGRPRYGRLGLRGPVQLQFPDRLGEVRQSFGQRFVVGFSVVLATSRNLFPADTAQCAALRSRTATAVAGTGLG
jgi:hypothetical protein